MKVQFNNILYKLDYQHKFKLTTIALSIIHLKKLSATLFIQSDIKCKQSAAINAINVPKLKQSTIQLNFSQNLNTQNL